MVDILCGFGYNINAKYAEEIVMDPKVKRINIKTLQQRTKKTVSMQKSLRGITPFHTDSKNIDKTDNVQNKGYNKD